MTPTRETNSSLGLHRDCAGMAIILLIKDKIGESNCYEERAYNILALELEPWIIVTTKSSSTVVPLDGNFHSNKCRSLLLSQLESGTAR